MARVQIQSVARPLNQKEATGCHSIIAEHKIQRCFWDDQVKQAKVAAQRRSDPYTNLCMLVLLHNWHANVPMSGAGARSAEASDRLAGYA
ncbi:MAG TPA: hypothetical protein VJ646_03425 [Candidatus Binatia bacterium]|nr:hypothetical protein [Candidatus Binatia bacterium]